MSASASAKLGKKEILQAIVLADDFTSNLSPMQDEFPSALIPVVNVPLLDYLIEILVKSRIQELYLYCSNHVDLLKKYVQCKNTNAISICLIISDGCQSLGDALRDIDTKGLIRSDFILIRGNAFANVNLQNLLNSHRARVKKDKGAAMTMVLRDLGSINNPLLAEETCLVASSGSNNKVLFYKRLEKEEKKVKLELEWFLEHDQIEISSSLFDTHIYLCSPSVLPLFSDNFDFQTMEDFIKGVLINEEILDSRIYWQQLRSDEYALPVTSWQTYCMLSREILQRYSYPLVPDMLPFLRNFVYMSRSTYKHRSAVLAKGCTLKRDSVIGPDTTIGENSVVSKSVIGADCTIGRNVIIEDSIVAVSTVIKDNCIIKKSIAKPHCIVEINVQLYGCVISPYVRVPAETTYTNSVLNNLNSDIIATKLSEQYCDANDESFFKCNNMNDCDNHSTDTDESSSDEDSSDSLIHDDANKFLSEVISSLLRGYQDKLDCKNLIYEINSSRYAYNVSIQEVTYNVTKAILSLPLDYLSEMNSTVNCNNYQKTLKTMIIYFHPIILKYVNTEDAQKDCLRAIEEMANTTQELLLFMQHLLHFLYERDILSEEKILEWHDLIEEEDETKNAEIKKIVQPFIKWLQEAEEDSSENESNLPEIAHT